MCRQSVVEPPLEFIRWTSLDGHERSLANGRYRANEGVAEPGLQTAVLAPFKAAGPATGLDAKLDGSIHTTSRQRRMTRHIAWPFGWGRLSAAQTIAAFVHERTDLDCNCG